MRKTNLLLVALMGLVVWSGCRSERDEPDDAANQNDNDSQVDNDNDNTGGGGGALEPEQGVAELSRFESAQELEDYFKGQILAQNRRFDGFGGRVDVDFSEEAPPIAGGDDLAGSVDGGEVGQIGDGGADPGPAVGEDGSGDFSGTTVQEEGVDESDVVKTDGQYIYVMTGQQLQIVAAQPPGDMELLSTFDLEGFGRDLYLVGDLAVALTSSSGVFLPTGGLGIAEIGAPVGPRQADEPFIGVIDDGDFIVEPWFRPRPQTVVTVIDISDRSAPTLASQTVFDGRLSASRMIDGVLRLVLANFPEFYYDVIPLGATGEELGLDQIDLDVLLPDFVTVGPDGQTRRGNVVGFDGFFRPIDPDGFGVTTIITLNTDTPDEFDAVAVVAEPGLIYASTEALYLTDTDYYFGFRRVETDIYKFEFTPDSVNLVAVGRVPGRILNQYSMSEYQGYLRVASSTDRLFIWETDEQIPSSNAVYIMDAQDGDLAIVGSIPDIAPGELIQSARFLGARGYLVTFERIDPFFTLDLADPLDPQIIGELKLPGFSTFITPMDENHVLTVGVYVDPDGFGFGEGVQLSIFDVEDFANPQQIHNVVIGGAGTHSEATFNPKAFTYFASQDLLALPIEHFGQIFFDDGGLVGDVDVAEPGAAEGSDGQASTRQEASPPLGDGDQFQGLFVYRVTAEAGFDYQGSISTWLDDESYWWTSFTRGVFIDDHVYAVTERAVVSSPTAAVDEVSGTLALPDPFRFDDEPVKPGEPIAEPAPDVEGPIAEVLDSANGG